VTLVYLTTCLSKPHAIRHPDHMRLLPRVVLPAAWRCRQVGRLGVVTQVPGGGVTGVTGRGLHSSTFQLNLSRF